MLTQSKFFTLAQRFHRCAICRVTTAAHAWLSWQGLPAYPQDGSPLVSLRPYKSLVAILTPQFWIDCHFISSLRTLLAFKRNQAGVDPLSLKGCNLFIRGERSTGLTAGFARSRVFESICFRNARVRFLRSQHVPGHPGKNR